MESAIVCPFCEAREPLLDPQDPILFTRFRGFAIYRCPCGAVASPCPSAAVPADWMRDTAEELLCRGCLETEGGACTTVWTYVSGTEPVMLLLWAKRRAAPGA